MHIVVMGAGGVGGYFGAKLARAGETVTLIARGEHPTAIQRDGLRIRSSVEGESVVRLAAVEDVRGLSAAEVILFCVKSFDTETAAERIRPIVGPDTAVLSLQNGIDNEDTIDEILGPGHAMGGVAQVFAAIDRPGVIAHHFAGRIIFGELDRRLTPRAESLARAFARAAIDAELSTDIRRALWEKYVLICAVAGMTALTRCPIGVIRDTPECWRMLRAIVEEIVALAAAAKAGLAPGIVDQTMQTATAIAPGNFSSLYQDLNRSKRLELEALHGHAVRLGERFGVATPAVAAVYAAHPTGDLMTRASSDVSAVKALVGFGAVSLAATAFAFAGALLAMLAVDPWLTLWALAPYPAMIVLSKRFNAVVHERSQAAQDQLGVLSAKVQEYLAGMAVVRAYTLEARATREFGRENTEYLRRSLALARSQSSFAPPLGLIAGVGTLIVLWVGGKAVVDGRLTLGALAAFNGYLAYLAWPTIALGWTLSIVRRGLTSMHRIQEITESAVVAGEEKIGLGGTEPPRSSLRPPTVESVLADPATADPATTSAPSIRFADVTFAYDGRPPALRGVSFSVGAGETVAVVGPTGSGKSTLGLLLARLWEAPPGTVLVGERDVAGLPRGALRVMLGYVPQEGFLFSRSIAENIALGREDVDAARIREAAVAAGIADETQAFTAGFDTVVGERGLTLSGGQRQRVALARALVGRPPILILDDPFASVDAAKEEEIAAKLRALAQGRTVLLMTHRLRAAQLADRVVVLDAGRVVEQGRHADLVSSGGLYARLWRIQQLEEEIARA